MLEKPSDLSPLTDANFVHRAMTHLDSRPIGDRGPEREGKPWPGLGKRVEVMRLASGDMGLDQAAEGVRKMGISS
jgi:type 2A phosphatase activator TIP41